MLCEFQRMIYPTTTATLSPDSFMIVVYRPCEIIRDSTGKSLTQVKAVGYGLPTSENLRYEMEGRWSNSAKHGIQFEVENYSEVIIPTKEGIVAYLSSGQIKGIGPKLAERIYDAFGLDTLDILDKEPNRLLSIPGIGQGKIEKILESYLANRAARDVVAFLAPHGITANRAVKLYQVYKEHTMDIVQHHPYQLCEMAGIGFKTADQIAQNMGLDRFSPERTDAALLQTLADAEEKGNLCLEKRAFLKACAGLLETPEITEEMMANRAMRLLESGKLLSYRGNVYRARAANAEKRLAKEIVRLLSEPKEHHYVDLDRDIQQEETLLRLRLASEQRNAVKMALTEGISIVTGGPGTGKTLIQRAILDIYRKRNPEGTICCCAPTGRAARRMEQSTGYPASTVHKTLGLFADNGDDEEVRKLDVNLILVDEVSMVDIYLAAHLLEAVKDGSQLILIGDADQLPSVGPGAVLSEMIASERIPVARLDKVFRQNADSHIAVNAKLIRHGNLYMEYGDDFEFIDSPSTSESAEIIQKLYLQEIARYGVDNVALLTPYRKRTETGANALNEVLRNAVNPANKCKAEIVYRDRKFREGDKVMQVKNRREVNNGDIGYVKKIIKNDGDTTVLVDYGDDRMVEYEASELPQLDLGYATTVHKSQGTEYKSVIINLQTAHFIMLTRPLIYTAITRGKERVIIVGEKKALCMAIRKLDTEKRGTCLAARLQELLE